jgi:hypothetical protein
MPCRQIEQCFRKNGIIAGGFASYISDKFNAYGDIDIFIPQTQGALEDVDSIMERIVDLQICESAIIVEGNRYFFNIYGCELW